MFWDYFLPPAAMALVVFGGWSLLRLLKARQVADDRKYGSGAETRGDWAPPTP